MKKLFLVLFLSLFCYLNAQELYDFNLNTRVNINGQPHFKIDYYPTSTNTNYKGGGFYPDVESNTNVKKHTFVSDCTITYDTDFRTSIITPTPDSTQVDSNGFLTDENTVLIVPAGVTVTIEQTRTLPTILIKGRVVSKPSTYAFYEACKTIIFPGGVFESAPTQNRFNHTISLAQYLFYPTWDPLKTSSFISLGGNVTIRGFNTDSVWTGSNSSYTSYGSTFLRSFPFTTSNTPVYKMSGIRSSNNVAYTMDSYYTGLTIQPGVYAYDSKFGGAGYLFIRPWDKNVWITGSGNSSMLFTGNSIVDIQNSVFHSVGHTNPTPIDDNTLDSNNNVNHYGSNLPDRYPITLLHNKLAVNIQNTVFLPITDSRSVNMVIARAFIGAKRSFGNLIGNAFVLTSGTSGISLLHGTEQFNINLNAFISTYTDTTTTSSRSFPDIDYLNGGIITTSPYSTYQGNAFEGTFKGGAVQVIPTQNRATLTGLSSDNLLGIYSGLTQDNNDYKTNSLWSTVVFKDHFFSGEAEFRVTYAKTSQPPIKINFLGGWFVGQRPSLTLPSNIANIELFYDSPYIANSLSINDKQAPFYTNTHPGEYNAVSIKNSIAIGVYTFFSDSFKCKYISVVDSKFSHFSSTANFIKKNTDQLFMSNVNGTRMNTAYSVQFFFPLFNLSPLVASSPLLPANQINMSFIPNFDYSLSNGQNINFVVNDVLQSTLTSLLKTNYVINVTSTWNVVNFPTLSNGLYSVLVLSKAKLASMFYEAGPYFGNTYIVDSNAPNFYLGIDLTSTITPPQRALTIFGKQWTRCGWVSGIGKCTTTGVFSSVATPSSVQSITGTVTTTPDEASMLTSYLVNNVASSIPSVVNITLPGNQVYKFFIYTYNPTFTGSNILNPLPIFNIKINGKYQEPFTRSVPTYQKYQKLGPFYWNNELSTNQELNIEWASDNIKNAIPISGIEIYSSITTPYPIPTA